MEAAKVTDILAYYGIEIVCENCEKHRAEVDIHPHSAQKLAFQPKRPFKRELKSESKKTPFSRLLKIQKSEKCQRKNPFGEFTLPPEPTYSKENRFFYSPFRNVQTTPNRMRNISYADALMFPHGADGLGQNEFFAKENTPMRTAARTQADQTPCGIEKSVKSGLQLTPMNHGDDGFDAFFTTATKHPRSVFPDFGPLRVLDFDNVATVFPHDGLDGLKINNRFFEANN